MNSVGLFDGGPLRFLPFALREPRRAWLAILVGAALTLAGSLTLSAIASQFAPTLAKRAKWGKVLRQIIPGVK